MKILSTIWFISLCTFTAIAQVVPHKIHFANMELKLSSEAIKDIQTDVDALTRSEKYFQLKLERVDMYMPIIERIFAEEGLPDDFKYLVIQESALISDAVSSSNAVGFWQFKEISGLENDLRIDRVVDERKNIVSATRAAANYLKSHNKVFDNWAYALIAYQRGVGGAKSVIDERYFGAKKMPITKNTYWYLKKYLAHKIAFESVLRSSTPTYYLLEKKDQQGKTLAEIAQENQVELELLKEYNKWLEKWRIPDDKNYTVIIPLAEQPNETPFHEERKDPFNNIPEYTSSNNEQRGKISAQNKAQKNATIAHEIKVNGLDAIVAAEGYTIESLATKAGLSEKKFRRYNDMSNRQKIQIGEIYYLEKKLNRAKYYYHTVSEGESMWEISQKYGLKLHKLYRKNRMKDPNKPTAGRVLWLRLNRPSSVDIEYRTIEKHKAISTNSKTKEITASKEKTDSIHLNRSNKEAIPIEIYELPDTTKSNDSTNLPLAIEKTEPLENTVSRAATDTLSLEEEAIYVVQEKEQQKIEQDDLQLMNYTIRKGDTFFSISNQFNMEISALLSYNKLSIKDTLSIGQVIVVNEKEVATAAALPIKPATEYDNAQHKKHTVTSGETLYGIAKTYSVGLDDLMKWNDKNDYTIKEGEIIIIKLNN